MATVQWSFSTRSSLYRWNHYLLASTPNATDGASDYEFYNFADKLDSIPAYSKIKSVIFWTRMGASIGKNEGYVKINGSGGTKFCEGSGGTDWFNLNAVNGFPYVNGNTSQINLVSYCHSMTQDAGWLPNLYYYVSKQGSVGVARNFSIELTITWDFTPPQFTVNVSGGEGGGASGGGTTECGGSRTITATADAGYEFIGWSDGDESNPRTITCNNPTQFQTTYNLTAQFRKLYTVIWKNHDGTVLETDNNVPHGTTPTYNGATPTKPSTAEYTYTFSGWKPSIGTITSDTNYIAQFTATKIKYTINFVNYDNSPLETKEVEYGVTPTYTGVTPKKPSDAQYDYVFSTWSPSIVAVTGTATYKAVFNSVLKYYTVSATDGVISLVSGNLADGKYSYGSVLKIIANEKAGYKFVNWSGSSSSTQKEIEHTVISSASFIANYKRLQMKFKSVKILHHSTNEVASPTNPLIGGEDGDQAIIKVEIALE